MLFYISAPLGECHDELPLHTITSAGLLGFVSTGFTHQETKLLSIHLCKTSHTHSECREHLGTTNLSTESYSDLAFGLILHIFLCKDNKTLS